MKLLTSELLKQLPPLYATEDQKDPSVICKFFDPCGSWTWFVTEFDPKKRLFFGLVHGFEDELGYFSLDDLEAIKGPLGLGIERDCAFHPTPLSVIREQIQNTRIAYDR